MPNIYYKMDSENILKQFKEKVCEQISLETKGVGKFFVKTPFTFEDGDGLVIFLRYDKDKNRWLLTDEGHTFMHLSYFIDERDFSQGTRNIIIENSKKMFNILEDNGELYLEVNDDDFGNTLYDFVQGLLKITDITYLSRERTETTFFEDFENSIKNIVQKKQLSAKFYYYLEQYDKNKIYPIDCYIETKKEPIIIFAINSDNKCRDAIISILRFDTWNIKFHPVGIFENQVEISRKLIAQFSDVSEKQISALENIEHFEKYLDFVQE